MKGQVLVTMAALSGLVALGAPAARAQSEIDPDHFELSNVEPFDKAQHSASREATAARFEGKVRLAYIVQGNSTNLRAGGDGVRGGSEHKIVSWTARQDGKALMPGRVQNKARGNRTTARGSVMREKLETGSAARPATAS
jgi:hypothetical protein